MPTASQTHAQRATGPHSRSPERRRGALRALLAAFVAAPPHPAYCPWLAPPGVWLSFTGGRRR
jgi:hypothetical protein